MYWNFCTRSSHLQFLRLFQLKKLVSRMAKMRDRIPIRTQSQYGTALIRLVNQLDGSENCQKLIKK